MSGCCAVLWLFRSFKRSEPESKPKLGGAGGTAIINDYCVERETPLVADTDGVNAARLPECLGARDCVNYTY